MEGQRNWVSLYTSPIQTDPNPNISTGLVSNPLNPAIAISSPPPIATSQTPPPSSGTPINPSLRLSQTSTGPVRLPKLPYPTNSTNNPNRLLRPRQDHPLPAHPRPLPRPSRLPNHCLHSRRMRLRGYPQDDPGRQQR